MVVFVAALLVVGSVAAVKHVKDRRQRKRSRKEQEHGVVEYDERYYNKTIDPPEYSFAPRDASATPSSIYSRKQGAI